MAMPCSTADKQSLKNISIPPGTVLARPWDTIGSHSSPEQSVHIINHDSVAFKDLQQIFLSIVISFKFTIIDGLILDHESHLLLGSLLARLAVHTLHHAANRHQDACRTMAYFHEHFVFLQNTLGDNKAVPQMPSGKRLPWHTNFSGHIRAKFPWHTLTTDVMGPLPTSQGYLFIISVNDCLSKYISSSLLS